MAYVQVQYKAPGAKRKAHRKAHRAKRKALSGCGFKSVQVFCAMRHALCPHCTIFNPKSKIRNRFRTHLKNRILVQDSVFALRLRRDTRGGAELFQDNWIPHRFYYTEGRRPRCGISRLIP
jgi:hypothetical protein